MSLSVKLERLAEAVQFPVASLRLCIAVILTYFAGFLFNRLPNDRPNLKHWFSIVLALLLHAEILSSWIGLIHLSTAAVATYFLAGTIKHKMMPQLIMILTMLHLSYTHICRMDDDSAYSQADFSAAHMILVIKLTSFAFNVQDGRQDEKQLNEHQKEKRITEMPSLLEYMGYIFYFGSFLVGPACEFTDYRNFCTMEMFKTKGKIHRPSGLLESFKCLAQSIISVGLLVGCDPLFSIKYCLTEDYQHSSLLYKLSYLQMAGALARFKYYFIWKLSEGVCVLTGLAFNGYDAHGKILWNRVSNVRIKDCELAESSRELMDSWNIGTNRWLRHYVYMRLVKPGQKSTFVATFATYIISAIWHGFYPGYYLTFASGAIVTTTARTMRRTFRPIVVPGHSATVPSVGKRIYDVLGWFLTQTINNYIVAPFQILTFAGSWSVWQTNGFAPHIAMITMYCWLVYAGGARWIRRSLWPASAIAAENERSSKVVVSSIPLAK
ncbi:MBOAT, membrane-bound O-acyltransferase family-domain-containing protein [Syncephalis fuscata]|nr:MBOAT, membrane-bound O-acyltransferase family-domain-containing protein [Syncephalis fuscata]